MYVGLQGRYEFERAVDVLGMCLGIGAMFVGLYKYIGAKLLQLFHSQYMGSPQYVPFSF